MFGPEIVVSILALGLSARFILKPAPSKRGGWLTFLGLAIALGLSLGTGLAPSPSGGPWRLDSVAALFRFLILTASLLAAGLSLAEGDFSKHAFLLWATLGALLLASTNDLAALFLVFLLLGLALVPLLSPELFFVFPLGSAAILLGSALLYGLTGLTNLEGIAERLGMGSPIAILAAGLLLGGLGLFALLVPFHQWVIDSVEESSFSVGFFLLSVPSIAAFAAMLRLFPFAMLQAKESWLLLLVLCIVLALVWANGMLLTQRTTRGFLSYSFINQFSFAFLGMAAIRPAFLEGIAASWIQLLAGLLALAGVAAVFAALGKDENAEGQLISCQGLWRRAPLLASSLTFCLLALVGLPFTLGFWGKWFLLGEAFAGGRAGLALLAAATSVIPLGVSAHLIRSIFRIEGEKTELDAPASLQAVAIFAFIASLGLFFCPGFLWSLGIRAAFGL